MLCRTFVTSRPKLYKWPYKDINKEQIFACNSYVLHLMGLQKEKENKNTRVEILMWISGINRFSFDSMCFV